MLAMDLPILILDEPYANLDYSGVKQVNALLKELKKSGKTIILLTHEIEKCLGLADKFIVLFRGEKVFDGTPEEGLKENIPFKAAGIKFIQFAKEEPQLFKFLFLQKNDDNLVSLNYLPNTDSNADVILETVIKEYGLSKEDAKKLYNHLTIYTFGIASLLANGSISFDLKEINILLSDMFLSLIKNYKSNK